MTPQNQDSAYACSYPCYNWNMKIINKINVCLTQINSVSTRSAFKARLMPCKNECAIIDTIYTRSVPTN